MTQFDKIFFNFIIYISLVESDRYKVYDQVSQSIESLS